MYVAVWSGEGNELIDEHHVLVFRWTVYMIAVSYPMQSLLAIPSFCLQLQIFKDSVRPHRAPGPLIDAHGRSPWWTSHENPPVSSSRQDQPRTKQLLKMDQYMMPPTSRIKTHPTVDISTIGPSCCDS